MQWSGPWLMSIGSTRSSGYSQSAWQPVVAHCEEMAYRPARACRRRRHARDGCRRRRRRPARAASEQAAHAPSSRLLNQIGIWGRRPGRHTRSAAVADFLATATRARQADTSPAHQHHVRLQIGLSPLRRGPVPDWPRRAFGQPRPRAAISTAQHPDVTVVQKHRGRQRIHHRLELRRCQIAAARAEGLDVSIANLGFKPTYASHRL